MPHFGTFKLSRLLDEEEAVAEYTIAQDGTLLLALSDLARATGVDEHVRKRRERGGERGGGEGRERGGNESGRGTRGLGARGWSESEMDRGREGSESEDGMDRETRGGGKGGEKGQVKE